MSLTSELDNPNSTLMAYFKEHFPNVVPVRNEWNARVVEARTIKPGTPKGFPWGMIGRALYYRIRYYFAVTPFDLLVAGQGVDLMTHYLRDPLYLESGPGSMEVMAQDISGVGASKELRWRKLLFPFLDHLDLSLKKRPPVGRRLAIAREEELCRFCYVLALLEELRRPGSQIGSPLFSLPSPATAEDLLALVDKRWVRDLVALSWAFHDGFYKPFVRGRTTSFALHPTFAGSPDIGGANAGLILDHYLLEIKTTIRPHLRLEWLYELIGYVLLDYNDQYRIGEVGIYLSRQVTFFRWPLAELLATLTRTTHVQLPQLRDEFRKFITSSTEA